MSYFSVLPNCLLIIHGTLQRQAESVDFDRCSLNHDEQKTTERKSSSLKSKQYKKRMRVKKKAKKRREKGPFVDEPSFELFLFCGLGTHLYQSVCKYREYTSLL